MIMTLAEIITREVKDPMTCLHVLMRMKYEPSTCQYVARSDDGEILMAVATELLADHCISEESARL